MSKKSAHYRTEQSSTPQIISSSSQKNFRNQAESDTFQIDPSHDPYFYRRGTKAERLAQSKVQYGKFESEHLVKERKTFRSILGEEGKVSFELSQIYRKLNHNQGRQFTLKNELQLIKKTSEGAVLRRKKFKGFSASLLKKVDETKTIVMGTPQKEQTKKEARYSSSSTSFNASTAIKKHKQSNIKQIEKKLRVTVSKVGQSYDSKSVKQYIKKCGLPEDAKVFIYNSQDSYIFRILKNWGWVQNCSNSSPFFHLKWTYMPSSEDRPGDGQFFNHFKNSHQITSKSYLTKNLKNSQSTYGNTNNYYPKCFDIGNLSQTEEFFFQYQKNVMKILLWKVFHHFKTHRPREIEQKVNEYRIKFSCKPHSRQNNKEISPFRSKKFRKILFEDYKNPDENFIVHGNIIIQALKYWRQYRKVDSQQIDDNYHFLNFKKNEFSLHFSNIKKYTLHNDPFIPSFQSQFTKQYFCTPSKLLIDRVVREYVYWMKNGEFDHLQTYGKANIWIIKPSSTARGNGIYLSTDSTTILSSSKAIQSRIVQKYIEHPLIIKTEEHPLRNKKFDIRQWVLLKSIDPLQIYMFSHCYLRLCPETYDLTSLTDLKRHLTNYSINKTQYKEGGQSILSIEELACLLKKERNVCWDSQIKPKIVNIVIKSIKSCLEGLEDYGSRCFQLLGFDLLLDESLNPWLLQINMSPACEERTEWISKCLNEMGSGLLKLILPLQLQPPSEKISQKYQWDLIHEQKYVFNRKRECGCFEVVGTHVDIREDVRISDLQIKQYESAKKIQTFMKKYIPRLKKYRQQKEKFSFFINNYLYQFKQQQNFKTKKKQINTEKIENYLIGFSQRKKLTQTLSKKYTKRISHYLKSTICQRKLKNMKKETQAYQMFKQFVGKSACLATHEMCSGVFQINKKIVSLQKKCKEYLYRNKLNKKIVYQYVTGFSKNIDYRKDRKRYFYKYSLSGLRTYLSTIPVKKQTCQKQSNYYKKKIETYLKTIEPKKVLMKGKLCQFQYTVNRILRVTKRRVRCQVLKDILIYWNLDKIKFHVHIIQAYAKVWLLKKSRLK